MLENTEQFRSRVEQDTKGGETSVATVACNVMTECLAQTEASTYSELLEEVERTMKLMLETPGLRHRIALKAGCELYKRYITRIPYENKDFDEVKRLMVKRGQFVSSQTAASREGVARKLDQFLQPNATILTHGLSRSIIAAIDHAAKSNRQLKLIFTESLPERKGLEMAHIIKDKVGAEHEIVFQIIRDSNVAAIMSEVDCVLIGAEGVVESGGIINTVGTYQIAMVAKALGKPVYVAVESYKFVRSYPLAQSDVQQPPDMEDPKLTTAAGDGLEVISKFLDYTPPEYITLLITDLNQGTLTPSAVSDELIKLYHEPLLTL
jgi:translation initiation factor eIF-2B subunit alpha